MDGQQQQRLTFKLALADEGAGGAGGDLRAFHRQNQSSSRLAVDHAARGRPLALSTSQLLCKMRTVTALVLFFVFLFFVCLLFWQGNFFILPNWNQSDANDLIICSISF